MVNKSETFTTENMFIVSTTDVACDSKVLINQKESQFSNEVDAVSSDIGSLVGPVIKLPVETKIVMRLENTQNPRITIKKSQKTQSSDIKKKIDAACCLESTCVDRLTELDSATSRLRKRVEQLAKREAERLDLLERAEAAWKDLEMGYHRRLAHAEEKQEDITKQIKNLIDERSGYKDACIVIAKQIEARGEDVKKDYVNLKNIEKEFCERARKKFQLIEEVTHADASLAEQQCRAAQLSRDLQLKEEQARRKVKSFENEVESLRGLKFDSERALRNELGAVKDQVANISKLLLLEDNESKNISNELEELNQKKINLTEDLDACKIKCDSHMQGKIEELKTKTNVLADIRENILDCRCKLPQDSSVEAKRTPSIAAICRCTSENEIPDSCSCTSLRSSLMSNLLKELFGGLQSELGETGPIMPCQLLKCLEDKHNWDHSSAVKTHLRTFFSQLLIGELDIAIASSIEKYHAKWVGASCADQDLSVKQNETDVEEWQQRNLDKQAQKLATQLAEQLFQERAELIMQKAKDIIKSSPPPCDCDKTTSVTTYSCILKTPTKSTYRKNTEEKANSPAKGNTFKNSTPLHFQGEDSKIQPIKGMCLKHTHERKNKGRDNRNISRETKKDKKFLSIKQIVNHRAVSTDRNATLCNIKFSPLSKKQAENVVFIRDTNKLNLNRDLSCKYSNKGSGKRSGQSFAVNLCLCDPQRDHHKILSEKNNFKKNQNMSYRSHGSYQDNLSLSRPLKKLSNTELVKPGKQSYDILNKQSKISYDLRCSSECGCFHKIPSSRSIDKLLETYRREESCLVDKRNSKDEVTQDAKHVSVRRSVTENSEILFNYDLAQENDKNLFMPNSNEKILTIYSKKIQPVYSTSNYVSVINCEKGNELLESPDIIKSNVAKAHAQVNITDNVPNSNIKNEKKLYRNHNTQFSSNEIIEKHDMNFDDKSYLHIKENPTHDQCCKYTSIEKLICDTQISVQSCLVEPHLGTNCSLTTVNQCNKCKFPYDSHYNVKFLGVSLNNNTGNHTSCDVTNKLLTNKSCLKAESIQINNVSQYNENKPKLSYDNYNNFKEGNNVSFDIYNSSIKSFDNNNKCTCCNKDNEDENNDLEINTFELLTEYFKKKLEDLKLSTSTSASLPCKEDILYSDILKRIKEIILEKSTEITCNCLKQSQIDRSEISWRRACGLLQEYLRSKIKRIQCSCSINAKNSDIVVHEILEKICELIEYDFRQLKKIYNHNNTLKFCNNKIKIDNLQSFNDAVINNLSQVTADLISEVNPVCDTVINKNISEYNIEVSNPIKESNAYNEAPNSVSIFETGEINKSRKQTLTPNTNVEQIEELNEVNNVDVFKEHALNLMDVQNVNNNMNNSITKSLIFEKKVSDNNFKHNTFICSSIPYIGYTINCSCDQNLGTCICAKSLFDENKIMKNDLWKDKSHTNISYIMKNVTNSNQLNYEEQEDYIKLEKGIYAHLIGEDVELKSSKQCLHNFIHDATNTSHIYSNNETVNLSYDEWDDCESSPCCQTNNEYVNNQEQFCSYFNSPVDKLANRLKDKIILDSDEVMAYGIRSQNCNCEMVPICHVKMLVGNIESKLVNSMCTCDSMDPKVCPVHFETSSNFN
ncbi:unnamed protein product [Parnassius mnemosyne]|uniref:Uncharacterized protein n=1 Tax=Parnassius mnemosyne TaxID=213953 RepID=A0AAV1LWG3_9NEOP